jgi:hypothetical protein
MWGVGFFVVVATLAACTQAKDTVIPTDVSKWDTDLAPAVANLQGTDRQLAVAYLDRTKSAASFSGQAVPTAMTLSKAIDEQKAYDQSQIQQRQASRNQQESLDQRRKDAEQQAAEVFGVKLTDKEIILSDVSGGNRPDEVAFTFELSNQGSKDLSNIEGSLLVSDNFFGTELKTTPLNYRQTIPVGGVQTYRVSIPLSPSAISDQRVRNTDLAQMKVTFTPSLVQFADGSKLEFTTAFLQP